MFAKYNYSKTSKTSFWRWGRVEKIRYAMRNERSARGVQKTSPMGLNLMIPGGVVRPGSKDRFSGLAQKRVDRSHWTFSWRRGMFRSALRSREKLVAETFLVDDIQGHTAYAVSFIDIFRIDGLCLEGWNHLDIEEEVSAMNMSPWSSSASPPVRQVMLLIKCARSHVPLRIDERLLFARNSYKYCRNGQSKVEKKFSLNHGIKIDSNVLFFFFFFLICPSSAAIGEKVLVPLQVLSTVYEHWSSYLMSCNYTFN